jgi:hypothetical protein
MLRKYFIKCDEVLDLSCELLTVKQMTVQERMYGA